MKNTLKLAAMAAAAMTVSANAQIVISQYYEGTSNNYYIEIKNIGSTDFNLATLAIGNWNNSSAEGYKTNTAPSFSLTLSGTLSGGSVYLMEYAPATVPGYATPDLSSISLVFVFSGNDSIALYTAGTFSTANVIDAIGFTNTGNEGANKSFVRISPDAGWNTTTGSNATTFSTVWSSVTLDAVDNATAGTDARLGASTLAIPEPSTVGALMIGGLLAAFGFRRRASV
jgi:predicted extracellular nuclease